MIVKEYEFIVTIYDGSVSFAVNRYKEREREWVNTILFERNEIEEED